MSIWESGQQYCACGEPLRNHRGMMATCPPKEKKMADPELKPLNAFTLRTYLETLPDDATVEVQGMFEQPGNGKQIIGVTCMANKAVLMVK